MLRAFAGGRLFGEQYGAGTPWALALHGWRRTHADFDGALRGLDAVALDLPGFGATPPPPTPWGSPDYAAAVAETISEPTVVVGHSLGGRIAVHLAASRPDLVRALVLTGAPLLRRGAAAGAPSLRFRIGRALHRRRLFSDARMEALRQRYGSEDYRLAEGVMRDVLVRLLGETYDDALAAITCPVELVWGDDDTAAPLSVANELAARLPKATLTVCAGAGHLTPLTVPDELRAAIERHRP
ncbi:MAG TPA: alpha/beta hydrolase [Acidimicrobiales bacterium]|nr:alpha/beta hydrolase [Acidimicrobiales bacterium]